MLYRIGQLPCYLMGRRERPDRKYNLNKSTVNMNMMYSWASENQLGGNKK